MINEIESSLVSTLAPVSINLSNTFINLFGLIPLIFISPFVTAAATRYVPASILSAGILCSVPYNLSTPSIVI